MIKNTLINLIENKKSRFKMQLPGSLVDTIEAAFHRKDMHDIIYTVSHLTADFYNKGLSDAIDIINHEKI